MIPSIRSLDEEFAHGAQKVPGCPLRCELCDGLEMARRGWDSSGPASLRRVGSFGR